MADAILSTGDWKYKDLGANHHMWTHATLWTGNVVTGTTRTATFTWFGGFHGAVQVAILTGDDTILAKTPAFRYGVDGTWIGTSDRSEPWSHQFDPNVDYRAQGGVRLEAYHFWAPDWWANIDQWLQVGQKVAPILAIFL
jgi:hypothetical protein